jgi:hypothetical protein
MDINAFAAKYDHQYRDRKHQGLPVDPQKDIHLTLGETGLSDRTSDTARGFMRDLDSLSEGERAVVLKSMDAQTLVFVELMRGKDVFLAVDGGKKVTRAISEKVTSVGAFDEAQARLKKVPYMGLAPVVSTVEDQTDSDYRGAIVVTNTYITGQSLDGKISHQELLSSGLSPEDMVVKLLPLAGEEITALMNASLFQDEKDAAIFRTALARQTASNEIEVAWPEDAPRDVIAAVMEAYGVDPMATLISLEAVNAKVPGAAGTLREVAFLTGDPRKLDGSDFEALRPKGLVVRDLGTSTAVKAGCRAIDDAIAILMTYKVDPDVIQLARAESGSRATSESQSEQHASSQSESSSNSASSFRGRAFIAIGGVHGSSSSESQSDSRSRNDAFSNSNSASTSFANYAEYLEYRAAKLPKAAAALARAEAQLQNAPLRSEDVGASLEALFKVMEKLPVEDRDMLFYYIRGANRDNPPPPGAKLYNGTYLREFLPKVFGLKAP